MEQVEPYRKLAEATADLDQLNRFHWDAEAAQYRDWGNHSEAVRLDWRYLDLPEVWNGMRVPAEARRRRLDLVRFVDEPPRLRFVPHFG